MRVVFVGSNPSSAAKTYNPFCVSTKSGQILMDWISRACPECIYASCNVSDNPTQANRPLTVKEIRDNLPRLMDKLRLMAPDRVVALGKTAEKALSIIGIEYYSMPHPSGLNRQLNDPKFVEKKINGLKEYLSPFTIESSD